MPMLASSEKVKEILDLFNSNPLNFRQHAYGVDSGGFGIFSDRALANWDHKGGDPNSLDRTYRHKETGQIYIQHFGPAPEKQGDTIYFFHYDTPLPRTGMEDRSMNNMMTEDEVEELPREVQQGLNYNAYGSITCNGKGLGITQNKPGGAQAFFSDTSFGDGGYGVYTHATGAIIIDTGNLFDEHFAGETVDVDEDDDIPYYNPDDLSIDLIGEIDLGSEMTIIDPCYLDSGCSDGVTLPSKGKYAIFQVSLPKSRVGTGRAHQGYILLPIN